MSQDQQNFASGSTLSKTRFGSVHCIHPQNGHSHTNTFIFLHGRGGTGEEFAEELMSTNLANGQSLQEALPTWSWIFPSSPERWSKTFHELMPEWFETPSLTDITLGRDQQMVGIRECVEYVQGIIDEEIVKLGGQSQNVVLGGISQGGAVAMWTMLCQDNDERLPGALIVSNTWLPLERDICHVLQKLDLAKVDPSDCNDDDNDIISGVDAECHAFVQEMMGDRLAALKSNELRKTPVLQGHGRDDAYVDIQLGNGAKDILSHAGFDVSLTDYEGADMEGHWFKEPEQMEDIYQFLTYRQQRTD